MAVLFDAANTVATAPSNAPAPSGAFSLTIRQLSLALPSGRMLFEHLDETFHAERTGLVGANGAGKSMLAKTLAGLIAPDAGTVVRQGSLAYVPQEIRPPSAATVASIAGLAPLFDALHRMDNGDVRPADIDLLEGRWQVASGFEQALAACGLPGLCARDDAAGLSGGELMRVALAGAFLSQAEGLVLDEPTNHLDRAGRLWLRERLQSWRGGAIVVSHDRELLDAMDRIVELDGAGLRSYGGNYTLYQEQRDHAAEAALGALEHARNERSASLRELRKQHDGQQARAARNAKAGKQANIAPILRGKLKRSAEVSAGREALRHAAIRAALDDAVCDAASRLQSAAPVALVLPATAVPAGKRIVQFDSVVPPYPRDGKALDFTWSGPMRMAITGPNGCGKTTLLKMLAGLLPPLSGTAQTCVPHAWLDQHASDLPPLRTVLERLRELESPLPERELRSRLALLGLQAAQVHTPSGKLSGGERLKAALACALWRKQPAQLLLLDEPTNHLDLASVRAIEQALQAYTGALAVVSHDPRFLDALCLTVELSYQNAIWRLIQK